MRSISEKHRDNHRLKLTANRTAVFHGLAICGKIVERHKGAITSQKHAWEGIDLYRHSTDRERKVNSPDQNNPAILIAEDDPDDRLLPEVAFSALKDACCVFFVNDGEELIEYLHHRGEYANSTPPKPGLILLGLNMPKKDGREALVEIKPRADLEGIPLVIGLLPMRRKTKTFVRKRAHPLMSPNRTITSKWNQP